MSSLTQDVRIGGVDYLVMMLTDEPDVFAVMMLSDDLGMYNARKAAGVFVIQLVRAEQGLLIAEPLFSRSMFDLLSPDAIANIAGAAAGIRSRGTR